MGLESSLCLQSEDFSEVSIVFKDNQIHNMLNIDVALNSFWQFARHWKNCDTSKLELNCEAGSLQMTMTSKLSHPDKLHFPPPPPDKLHFHPPPDPIINKKSPSMVRRQERCKTEA